MPVTKAVKNWRLFLSESVEMGKKADDRRERERRFWCSKSLRFYTQDLRRERSAVGEGRGRHPMDHRATRRCSTGSALAVPKPACLQWGE
jgi:hypothetical protein